MQENLLCIDSVTRVATRMSKVSALLRGLCDRRSLSTRRQELHLRHDVQALSKVRSGRNDRCTVLPMLAGVLLSVVNPTAKTAERQQMSSARVAWPCNSLCEACDCVAIR